MTLTQTAPKPAATVKIWEAPTAKAQINDIIRKPFCPIARVVGKEILADGRTCLIVTFPNCHDRHVEEWAVEAPAVQAEEISAPIEETAPTAEPEIKKVPAEFHQTNRRQFLSNIFGAAAVLPAIAKPQQSIAVHEAIEATKPEFWFGDLVDYFWTDEETNQRHSETGKIIGAAWDSLKKQWRYRVMWLSSTLHPAKDYPLDDGEFMTADEISKH
jgi:hypothetical protein